MEHKHRAGDWIRVTLKQTCFCCSLWFWCCLHVCFHLQAWQRRGAICQKERGHQTARWRTVRRWLQVWASTGWTPAAVCWLAPNRCLVIECWFTPLWVRGSPLAMWLNRFLIQLHVQNIYTWRSVLEVTVLCLLPPGCRASLTSQSARGVFQHILHPVARWSHPEACTSCEPNPVLSEYVTLAFWKRNKPKHNWASLKKKYFNFSSKTLLWGYFSSSVMIYTHSMSGSLFDYF